MDDKEKTELWLHYSSIWRNFLTHFYSNGPQNESSNTSKN